MDIFYYKNHDPSHNVLPFLSKAGFVSKKKCTSYFPVSLVIHIAIHCMEDEQNQSTNQLSLESRYLVHCMSSYLLYVEVC